jgi:hemerythrin superfamily protein
MTTEQQQTTDAVTFLVSQHAEIRRLFTAMDGADRSQDTFQALVRLLAVHETAEEEVVHPAARRLIPDGASIVDARLEEEDQAKKALTELEKLELDHVDFAAQYAKVRDMVLAHAEHEEQELFPKLRAVEDDDELRRMTTALQTAEAMAPTHPHAMAPESRTANLLVGPFVAMADRVRDALRGR